jgi:hypothetical protein
LSALPRYRLADVVAVAVPLPLLPRLRDGPLLRRRTDAQVSAKQPYSNNALQLHLLTEQRPCNHDPADIAYLAGIIDGEGCVQAKVKPDGTVGGIQIVVGQLDYRLIEFLLRFGGSSWRRYDDVWTWTLSCAGDQNLLRLLIERTIVKREQLVYALEMCSTSGGPGTRPTPEMCARRVEIARRMKELKHDVRGKYGPV